MRPPKKEKGIIAATYQKQVERASKDRRRGLGVNAFRRFKILDLRRKRLDAISRRLEKDLARH